MSAQEDYADVLAEAAESEIAVFHEFRLQFYDNSEALHIFFEGREDVLYYLPTIKRKFPQRPMHYYVCEGKPKLVGVRAEIYTSAYCRKRLMFFVDRDYDDFIGKQIEIDAQTYITDWYSIENNLVTDEALDVVLTELSLMSKRSNDYNLIRSEYSIAMEKFIAIMRPISAWIISARIGQNQTNLNNVNLADVIEFDASGYPVKKKKGFEAFRRKVGLESLRLRCSYINSTLRNIKSCEPKLWLRGKFELWFFCKWLRWRLDTLRVQRSKKGQRRWRVPSSLANNAIFEALGGRLSSTASLCSFLDQFALAECVTASDAF